MVPQWLTYENALDIFWMIEFVTLFAVGLLMVVTKERK